MRNCSRQAGACPQPIGQMCATISADGAQFAVIFSKLVAQHVRRGAGIVMVTQLSRVQCERDAWFLSLEHAVPVFQPPAPPFAAIIAGCG